MRGPAHVACAWLVQTTMFSASTLPSLRWECTLVAEMAMVLLGIIIFIYVRLRDPWFEVATLHPTSLDCARLSPRIINCIFTMDACLFIEPDSACLTLRASLPSKCGRRGGDKDKMTIEKKKKKTNAIFRLLIGEADHRTPSKITGCSVPEDFHSALAAEDHILT